uniref:Uncharacterized protein n=1 Tax=Gallus gallus TaxID=9031 RepID=A0A8V0Y3H7_CHICK
MNTWLCSKLSTLPLHSLADLSWQGRPGTVSSHQHAADSLLELHVHSQPLLTWTAIQYLPAPQLLKIPRFCERRGKGKKKSTPFFCTACRL